MSIDATPRPFRGLWEGDTKIVIGIDIGTTQTGVAFTFLQNGESQSIHRVTRWPGREDHSQQGKIPTLVWYDTNKKAVSFGAEAQLYTTEEQAEDNDWFLVKNFKLHLHPSDMQARNGLWLDPLPSGVSLQQIYSDFLGYLLEHTSAYFKDRLVNGRQIWEMYSPTMEVVIAHPNGWGIREQAFLRSAAVSAGCSTADQALRKVRFVTEGEASVHFSIHHTNLEDCLRPGINFAICDAGDIITETNVYSVISASPVLQLEEKRVAQSIQAGYKLVVLEAEKFLRKTLENINLPSDDVETYAKAGAKDFEKFTGRAFKNETSDYSIAFAHSRLNNAAIRTRRGRMSVPGSTIMRFFNPSVTGIMGCVDAQVDSSGILGSNVSYILLVGELGESPYLRSVFKKRYEPQGCQIVLMDDSTSKAIADGAVIWRVKHELLNRALPVSCGIETLVPFDQNDPDHQDRQKMVSASNWPVVTGRWKCLARKGITPDVNAIVQIPFSLNFASPSANLGQFELDIYSYSGDDEPVWMKNKRGGLLPKFHKAATIREDLETLREALESEPRIALDGTLQWWLDLNACMRFGDTYLEVYIEWREEGITRTGPCITIPVSNVQEA